MKKILILSGLVFFLLACSPDDDILLNELNANRQIWESNQIENYSWTETLSCECGGPLLRTIIVVNNIKDTVVFDESLLFEGYTYEDVFKASNTIQESFDFIESLSNQNVASLFVQYDEIYGFPTIISVNYDEDVIDDEILYRYLNFDITN